MKMVKKLTGPQVFKLFMRGDSILDIAARTWDLGNPFELLGTLDTENLLRTYLERRDKRRKRAK